MQQPTRQPPRGESRPAPALRAGRGLLVWLLLVWSLCLVSRASGTPASDEVLPLPPIEELAPGGSPSSPLSFSPGGFADEENPACPPGLAPRCEPLASWSQNWMNQIRGFSPWQPPLPGLMGYYGFGAVRQPVPCEQTGFWIGGLGRGFYLNDQRIQWSGLESTLGAEGIVSPHLWHQAGPWRVHVDSVFFINQRFDKNILNDPVRRSYQRNFEIETFEIFLLNVKLNRGPVTGTVGKDFSPFGRYYFPLYTNSRIDAPFIRTEAIHWVETGAFVHFTPGILVFDAAVVNGGENMDTNSSKALIARAGFELPWLICGASIKMQDGNGSEHQKTRNSHIGADGLVRWGRFDLSGEVIYDQYGLRQDYPPDQIFWGRSLYDRDIYNGSAQGLHGVGYYLNLAWTGDILRLDLNYGGYYPQRIGDPRQDTPIQRGILKSGWRLTRHLEVYQALIWENNRPVEDWRSGQNGFVGLVGFQGVF